MKNRTKLFAFLFFTICLNATLNAQQKTDTIQKANLGDLPYATICNVNGGKIALDILVKADSLICSNNNYKIISFTMIKIQGELLSNSNCLTTDMKKSIGQMKSGNKLFFNDIKAKSPVGKIVVLNPIILKIK
jgi:hypothetical protein